MLTLSYKQRRDQEQTSELSRSEVNLTTDRPGSSWECCVERLVAATRTEGPATFIL